DAPVDPPVAGVVVADDVVPVGDPLVRRQAVGAVGSLLALQLARAVDLAADLLLVGGGGAAGAAAVGPHRLLVGRKAVAGIEGQPGQVQALCVALRAVLARQEPEALGHALTSSDPSAEWGAGIQQCSRDTSRGHCARDF